MLPCPRHPGKRGRGRPSKALRHAVHTPALPLPVAPRRRALLTLYRRCLAVHVRLLEQAEELTRLESVLQRLLLHDLASVLPAQEAALVQGVIDDVRQAGAAEVTVLIDELTALVSWLRETHLP